MMDYIRWIASRFFGADFVTLIDYDGKANVRRVKFSGGNPYAARHGHGIRDVWLLDNGKLRNGSYVESWEPYIPLASKRLPEFTHPYNLPEDEVKRWIID